MTPTETALEALIDGITSVADPGSGQCGMTLEHEEVELLAQHFEALRASTDAAAEPMAYLYTNGSTNHEVPYLTVERDALFAELQDTRETPLYAHPPADAAAVTGEEKLKWRLNDGTAPHACHILAARFDDCEWVMQIVASPPSSEWEYWAFIAPPGHVINAALHPAPAEPAGLREALKDIAKGVFIDAATQVHYSWIDGTNGREPDFGEAASDYAESFADAYVDNITEALATPNAGQVDTMEGRA
jgi:hypothetical protein